jgi:hypothetical protein
VTEGSSGMKLPAMVIDVHVLQCLLLTVGKIELDI